MSTEIILSEKEGAMPEPSEQNRRFIQNAIELALSLGDFQKEIDSRCTPRTMLDKALDRVDQLISFDIKSFYLVDEESSDFCPTICSPGEAAAEVEQEMAFLIQNGYLAWAIRERRGISIYCQDGSRRIFLHVLATYSRVLGIFIGYFPPTMKRLPDASLEILSLVLRNTANAIESLTFCRMLQDQNDVLEQKVAEKTQFMLRFERQLMHAQKNEAIMALAGGIAHQFNNVLTGLVGHVDLLEMSHNGHSEVNQFIGQVRTVTERMSNLTRQLLAYVQGGKYKPRSIEINDLINGAFSVLRRLVDPKVHLVAEQGTEEMLVNVDITQMQMVLSAIVTNANEAITGEGQIRITTTKMVLDEAWGTEADDLPPGSWIRICIEDSGAGMDQDTQRRVFEPFFTTKFEGRGLGMAMVHGIVENHLGTIRITSRTGQGTRVALYLPFFENES